MINYISLLNEKNQSIFSRGEVTIIQRICALPFSYFCDKKLKDILLPSLISLSYENERNTEIINKEINLDLIIIFLKEKIQLEPIIEEEEMDRLDESSKDENNLSVIKINKDQFLTTNTENVINGLKKRTMSFSSTASSTKSCHDMIAGVSDFVMLYHRFPHNLWEKALEFYSMFGKKNCIQNK
jgi:hypothetical protein